MGIFQRWTPPTQRSQPRRTPKAEEVQADIVIGTDPDADRLGIAVRNHKGEMELLNGNQTMIVMTQFILDRVKREQNQTTLLGQRSFLLR